MTDTQRLREVTGAGVMDCKKALQATNGDMNKAMDWLRTPAMLRKWSVTREYYDN